MVIHPRNGLLKIVLIRLHIDNYQSSKDTSLLANKEKDFVDEARAWYLQAGQSKRIWNELYKVIDSSDVVIHVLDARDPLGTRCRKIEDFIRKEKPHKHLIFVLNKCDLIPTWATVSCHSYPSYSLMLIIHIPIGQMGFLSFQRLSHTRLPRIHQQLVRQRFAHSALASILQLAQR